MYLISDRHKKWNGCNRPSTVYIQFEFHQISNIENKIFNILCLLSAVIDFQSTNRIQTLHRDNISGLFYYLTISSHMHSFCIRRNLKLTWNFSQSESMIGHKINAEIPSRTAAGNRWHKTMTIQGQYLIWYINKHHHNPGTGWYINTILKVQPRTVTSAKFG